MSNSSSEDCKACMDLSKVGCQEVVSVPNKAVATIPTKTVACCANKEIVQVPCKAVAINKEYAAKTTDVSKLAKLPPSIKRFIDEKASICEPENIYVCDGSEEEYQHLLKVLQEGKWIQKLDKMKNW